MLVIRKNAPIFIQNVVVSLAFTVLFLRLWTSYLTPIQAIIIGNFHLAHMLWGGLFLFTACLLMLLYQNSRILHLSSWLTGIGFGFFIEELGKYISITQDYYYKPAAPLIYISFLVTVFVLLFVKRKKKTLRERMYHAISDLEEILDHDLQQQEFAEMQKTFKEVFTKSENPVISKLAKELDSFLTKANIDILQDKQSMFEKFQTTMHDITESIITRKIFRVLFYTIFAVRIVWVIPSIVVPLLRYIDQVGVYQLNHTLIDLGVVSSQTEFVMFVFTSIMEVLVAVGLFYALGLIVRKKRRGFRVARRLLLFSIIFLGIFNAYFDQFSSFISIGIDTMFLTLLTIYF